jgi:hypothetical protein
MNAAVRFVGAAALLGTAVACSNPPNPPPRGAATQGVAPAPASERSLNAPYYTGADPDFRRGSSGSRGGP